MPAVLDPVSQCNQKQRRLGESSLHLSCLCIRKSLLELRAVVSLGRELISRKFEGSRRNATLEAHDKPIAQPSN